MTFDYCCLDENKDEKYNISSNNWWHSTIDENLGVFVTNNVVHKWMDIM